MVCILNSMPENTCLHFNQSSIFSVKSAWDIENILWLASSPSVCQTYNIHKPAAMASASSWSFFFAVLLFQVLLHLETEWKNSQCLSWHLWWSLDGKTFIHYDFIICIIFLITILAKTHNFIFLSDLKLSLIKGADLFYKASNKFVGAAPGHILIWMWIKAATFTDVSEETL